MCIFGHSSAMRSQSIFNLLFLAFTATLWGQKSFNKTVFYTVMSSKDLPAINRELNNLSESEHNNSLAYEGALQMKKAGLVKDPEEKIALFKTGHQKLESCIEKDSINPELRFLRIMIQENAPKLMNYNKDLKKDAKHLRAHFKRVPDNVRQAIMDYSKTSKVLRSEDLNSAAYE
jgi:hypothetical protein